MAYDKFNILKSNCVPLPIENIDTDQIIPARFLKATDKKGFGDNLFRDWRYDKENNLIPEFVLNSSKYKGNILIAGDFNIIPEEIDVHDFKRYENDALGRLEIRKKYRELINLGFKDVYRLKNKTKQEYTFWDYFAGSWQKNYGMRIDHFLLSNNLIENVKSIKNFLNIYKDTNLKELENLDGIGETQIKSIIKLHLNFLDNNQ